MKKWIIPLFAATYVLFFSGCVVHKQTETEQQTFAAQGYTKVKVETQNGEITSIAETGGKDISVTFNKWANGPTLQDARLNLGKITVKIKEDTTDSVLRITVNAPINLLACGCDVKLILPQTIFVDLGTSNGKIDAQGHQAGMNLTTSNGAVTSSTTRGKADIKTSNGDIMVTSHEGNLVSRTSNGDLRVLRTTGDANLVTSNGKLVIEGHSGNVRGETRNGSIDASVVVPFEKGVCELSTSNGSIRAAVRDSVSATITLKTSNGKIDVDPEFKLSAVESQNQMFKAKLGEGSGSIFLKTTNGEITLEKF